MSIQSPTKESQEAMQAKTQAVPPMNVGSGLPEGGTVGQVLTKTATGAAWDDVPEELPEGGTTGQVLTLEVPEGEEDPVPTWADPEEELPAGGTAGQVLTKTANGCEWAAAAGGEAKPQTSNKINLTLNTTSAIPVIIGGDVTGNSSARRSYTLKNTAGFHTTKNHAAGTVTHCLFDAGDSSTTTFYPSERLVGRAYTQLPEGETSPETYYLIGSDCKVVTASFDIRLSGTPSTRVGRLICECREEYGKVQWQTLLRPIGIYWESAVTPSDTLILGVGSDGTSSNTMYLDNASAYAVDETDYALHAGSLSNFLQSSTGANPFKSLVLFE